MNTGMKNAQRVIEGIPPIAPQNPQDPIKEGAMSNVDIRAAIHSLTQVLATQVSRDTRVQANPRSNATTLRIRDFTQIYPVLYSIPRWRRTHIGSLMNYSKFFMLLGFLLNKKKLVVYQLKDIAHVVYDERMDERLIIE